MARNHRKQKVSQIICFCNNVSRNVIETAIRDGAQTLNEIYDKTTAGVGPCGGSCRRKIAPVLESFLIHGDFTAECEKAAEIEPACVAASKGKPSCSDSD